MEEQNQNWKDVVYEQGPEEKKQKKGRKKMPKRMKLVIGAAVAAVVLLPAAFIFAKISGLHMVWFAFPISDVFAIIFSGVCLPHVYRKEIAPLKVRQGK